MGLREFRLRARHVLTPDMGGAVSRRTEYNGAQKHEGRHGHPVVAENDASPPTRLRALIEAAPDARLKRDLENGRHRGGRLAVQVTPAADQLWHFFEKTNAQNGAFTRIFWCRRPAAWWSYAASPAAIQTICMPRGMAWYGYGRFQDQHRVGNFSAFRLCDMARPLGVRRIYRLQSLSDLS